MIEICREFGWDYYTYINQPSFFIDLIIEKMAIDNKRFEKEQKLPR